MVSVISGILERQGGLAGVVSQFENRGLGPTVRSWVGTGANQPITAEQVQHVLGADLLQQLAAKSGHSVPDLAQKLAQILPQAVDQMTPQGVLPRS